MSRNSSRTVDRTSSRTVASRTGGPEVGPLDRVRREFQAGPATAGPAALDALARRVGLSRDELDAAIGYWVHLGEIAVEPADACAGPACSGCPFAVRCPRPPGGAATSD